MTATQHLTVTFPKALWLSSNRRIVNHGQKSRIVRDIHLLVRSEAADQHLTPMSGPVMATWTVRYPKGVGWKHGDASNAHPTCKATLDALVESGLLEGDGPRFVTAETYQRGKNLEEPAVHQLELLLTSQVVSF